MMKHVMRFAALASFVAALVLSNVAEAKTSTGDLNRLAQLIVTKVGKGQSVMLDAPRQVGAVDKMFLTVADGPNGLFVMAVLSAPITVGEGDRASLMRYQCEQVALHADVASGVASGEFHGCGSTSLQNMAQLVIAASRAKQALFDAVVEHALVQLATH